MAKIILIITLSTLLQHCPGNNRLTLSEAVDGTTAPDSIVRTLEIVDVRFHDFGGNPCRGQIIVDKDLADEVRDIFVGIERLRFPVESVIPIRFDLPDGNTSMDTLNNTYAFHYRAISTYNTTKLSVHSYGRAIDINPFQNPAILRRGRVIPEGAVYDTLAPGTLTAQSPVVKIFKSLGWQWGGDWTSFKDYMHFEKP